MTPTQDAKNARDTLARERARFKKEKRELERERDEAVEGVALRRITLPSGDRVLLPRAGMDGEVIAMPNGLTFRVVEGGRAAVQLTDG